MNDDLGRILAALPHREPFRCITQLTMLEPWVRGTGFWIVTGDEHFFAGHFPDEPIVPGVLLAESLAQLCGLIAFAHDQTNAGTKPVRLAHIDVKVLAAVRPPAQIDLAATFVRDMGNLLLFDVAANVSGTAAATGRIVLAKTPHENPQ